MGRILLATVFLLLPGCAACEDDGVVDMFEPASFGTYEYDPQPEIHAPAYVELGTVEAGESVDRHIEVGNVGRAPLVVSRLETDDALFVDRDQVGSQWELEPGERRGVPVRFTSGRSGLERAELWIRSNDPATPRHRTVFVANQQQPCVGTGRIAEPRWQKHEGEGPMCWPQTFDRHGQHGEYEFAEIPPADDPDWEVEPDNHISFERRSTLCGRTCSCLDGGDFMYFQTQLFLPAGASVDEFRVRIEDVDDGARATVFNEIYPDGVTDPDAYAQLFGQDADANLAPYLVHGANRIVITQVDDCCSTSRIANVFVELDGTEVVACNEL